MKQYLIFLVSISVFLVPTFTFAGVACPANGTSQGGSFNPNESIPSGYGSGSNSFSGISFSGVGGALAGCMNVGSSAIGLVGDLFGGGSSSGGTPYNPSQVTASNAPVAGSSTIPLDEQLPGDTPAAPTGGGTSGGGTGGSTNIMGVDQSVPVADKSSKKSADELAKANTREQCLNGVAFGVAKNALQAMSTKTVNWAKTGYNGNPFYVRDIDSYLKNVANQNIHNFLQDIPDDDPVFGIALRSAIYQQVSGISDGRISKLMDTPEAKKYQAFQDDFTQGGWNSFLNPRNNALGAYFGAVDRLSSQVATQQQNVKDELVQGSGFLSMKECAEYEAGNVAGNGTSDKLSCVADYNSKRAGEEATCATKSNQILKDGCMQGVATKYSTLLASCDKLENTLDANGGNQARKCLRYETVTPGEIISQQVSEVVNSPVNQLIAADSINEVLGGYFDSLMNGLFSEGLGAMGSARSSFLSGLNVVLGSDGSPLPGVAETRATLGLQNSCSTGYSGDFDISRPQQLRAIIQAQKDYLNRVTDNNVVVASIIPQLGKLDYCIPGPNPTWQNGLADNYRTFLSSFQEKSKTTGGGFLFGMNSKTKVSFLGTPTFYDKSNGGYWNSYQWKFDGDTTVALGVINFTGQNIESLYSFLNDGYNAMIANYNNAFVPQQKIIDAFKNTVSSAADKNLAQGNISQSIVEIAQINAYAQTIPAYQTFYSESITEVSRNIAELDSINKEVNEIINGRGNPGDTNYIEGAKRRYIREQADLGITMNVNPDTGKRCIDEAYLTDSSPILGAPLRETKPVDPAIQASREASIYFYSHL